MEDYFYGFEKGEEKQMKRMTLSMICVLTFIGIALSASLATADDNRRRSATVSFGEWDPNDPDLLSPLDRLVADPAGGVGNNHELIPNVVKIKAGDSVNFIISGGHVVTIFDDGTQPGTINTANIEPATAACAAVAGGVISDSTNRIYRGQCSTGRRDGVEVVKFSKPGTYLVICARKNHFVNDGMFGFVKVTPGKGD